MTKSNRSQNLSVMITDIQGFTSQSSAFSRDEVLGLIRRHSQLMKPVINFYGGTIVKTVGDSFLCTFPSATDAVVCAIIIQLLLKEYNQKQVEDRKISLRVVINSGDISIEGHDIFGDAVNIASRMEGLDCFPGGTIGISETTYLLMNRNEITATKIGPKDLKGISNPVTVYIVPIEQQQLGKLPSNLLRLVEENVETPQGDSKIKKSLEEMSVKVEGFLRESGIGDKARDLGRTISSKMSEKKEFSLHSKEADLMKRLKSFGIDMGILLVALIILNTFWSVSRWIVFGRTTILYKQYISLSRAEQDGWRPDFSSGNNIYRRNAGLYEGIIDFNLKCPFLILWFYFALFWKLKSATPGQVFNGTAVRTLDGEELPWGIAFLRSAFFIFSILIFGIGAATFVLGGKKKTLYDSFCDTKVIELG
ncbi:MAG: adenylate/guanylate cyclase domain-containing protein [Candidatus Wallbacteria bacterium]|nr:adenylate/guanylate cyclase domain-containing protein [Candidatus Wallbacteria bacterium]